MTVCLIQADAEALEEETAGEEESTGQEEKKPPYLNDYPPQDDRPIGRFSNKKLDE